LRHHPLYCERLNDPLDARRTSTAPDDELELDDRLEPEAE
jgi:hypothetical protein